MNKLTRIIWFMPCVLSGLVSFTEACAQDYGGIKGFTVPFPITTFITPIPGERMRPAAKLLAKRDVGKITEATIESIYTFAGKGYLQLSTADGPHWVKRYDVEPIRAAVVDQAIAQKNGEFSCPPGKRRVATGITKDSRAGVARGIGGAGFVCQ